MDKLIPTPASRGIAPINKHKKEPQVYRVDIIGWDANNPIIISESEKKNIEKSLETKSFVEIGNNLINPTSIRFITALKEDTRGKVTYKKIELENGDFKVVKTLEE